MNNRTLFLTASLSVAAMACAGNEVPSNTQAHSNTSEVGPTVNEESADAISDWHSVSFLRSDGPIQFDGIYLATIKAIANYTDADVPARVGRAGSYVTVTIDSVLAYAADVQQSYIAGQSPPQRQRLNAGDETTVVSYPPPGQSICQGWNGPVSPGTQVVIFVSTQFGSPGYLSDGTVIWPGTLYQSMLCVSNAGLVHLEDHTVFGGVAEVGQVPMAALRAALARPWMPDADLASEISTECGRLRCNSTRGERCFLGGGCAHFGYVHDLPSTAVNAEGRRGAVADVGHSP